MKSFLCFAGLLSSLSACLGDIDFPSAGFAPVASGFRNPVGIYNAGDLSDRLFVVEQWGDIKIVAGGVVSATSFLTITNRVRVSSEQGLLGLAFPPDFSSKQHFYVNYTRSDDGATVVSRFSVSVTNANVAD